MAEGFLAETGKEPEEPEPVVHELEGKIGYCRECDDVHIDEDLSKLKREGETGDELSKRVREANPDEKFICRNCGAPMRKSRSEVKDVEKCWWCGSNLAIDREKLEE